MKQHAQVAPRVRALAQGDTRTPTQLLHSQLSSLDPEPTFEELCHMGTKWRVFLPLRCYMDFKEDLPIRPLFLLPNILPNLPIFFLPHICPPPPPPSPPIPKLAF